MGQTPQHLLRLRACFVYNADTMREVVDALRAVAPVETEGACAAYTLDGCTPVVVVKPTHAVEVGAVMQVCHRYRAPGVVWGGGTHVHTGNPASQYLWAMDMRGLARAADYSPADLVVTVEAGMTLSALQGILGVHHQWLPVDAPLPDVQTVGGIVASGDAGPKRQRYGLPREWLLAVRAVLPSGESIKAGVGVVKNVAGYDLPRLLAGSWGTLGVLVELTFKVAPLPEVCAAYCLPLEGAHLLSDLRDALNHPLLQPEMLEVTYRMGEGWQCVCGLAGFEEDVRWQSNLLRERTRSEWLPITSEEVEQLRGRYLFARPTCRCRCVVPPAQTADLLMWLSRRFAEAEVQAHFGAGVVRLWWAEDPPAMESLRELREQTHRLDGFCVLEHAPVGVKRTLGVWDATGGAAKVMRRLKERFDPQAILAPGRFVEGL
jgi:glycolate oxidase FAD binding subunit